MNASKQVEDAVEAVLSACPASRFVVGFSGGLDSTVLLAALKAVLVRKRDPGEITAFHIHHGLSVHADAWLRHCESVSLRLGVCFESSRVEVARGGNLEEAARTARYACWESRLQRGDVLLLGHHLDDQVETLLLRLARGGGAALLSGMPQSRPVGQGQLLRPLLTLPRSTLEHYAAAHGLSWVEDDSNADSGFDRNFLRHEVLPVLRGRWPDIAERIGASTRRLGEDAALAEAALDDLLAGVVDERGGLSIALLVKRPYPARIVRHWLRGSGLHEVTDGHIEQIVKQAQARSGASPAIDLTPGVRVRRHDGCLELVEAAQDAGPAVAMTWRLGQPAGFGALELSAGLGPSAGLDPALKRVVVRPREGGERLRLRGRQGSRSVKRLLADANVPVWLRRAFPLVYVDDQLAAVPGVAVAERFECDGPAWQLGWRVASG